MARIAEFLSYEPQSPKDYRVWVDLDQVQAVHESYTGIDQVTAITLSDQQDRVIVKADALEVVKQWKGDKDD